MKSRDRFDVTCSYDIDNMIFILFALLFLLIYIYIHIYIYCFRLLVYIVMNQCTTARIYHVHFYPGYHLHTHLNGSSQRVELASHLGNIA